MEPELYDQENVETLKLWKVNGVMNVEDIISKSTNMKESPIEKLFNHIF